MSSQDRIRTCMRNFLGSSPMARYPLVTLASTIPPPDYILKGSVAGEGLEPPTFGLWAQRATTAPPRYMSPVWDSNPWSFPWKGNDLTACPTGDAFCLIYFYNIRTFFFVSNQLVNFLIAVLKGFEPSISAVTGQRPLRWTAGPIWGWEVLCVVESLTIDGHHPYT